MTLIQRRLLSLGALCIVAGGALALVVWQDNKSVATQEQKAAAQKLYDLTKSDDIKTMTLTTPNGSFTIDHVGAGETAWQLSAPRQTMAEASTVDAMVRAALDLRSTGRVGGKGPADDMTGQVTPPPDLAIFGLAPPAYTLSLTGRDGHTETLLIGKKNSFDGSLYVKRADKPDVALVAGALEYQVDKDLFKLRDKRPVIVDIQKISRLTVTPKEGTAYTIERHGADSFVLTAPFAAPADEPQVTGILTALANVRAKSFVAEDASADSLRHAGLEAPVVRVQLAQKDGPTATLAFGQVQLPGDKEIHTFVHREGDGPGAAIIELGSDWAVKTLRTTPQALRDLHVLAFERDAVKNLTLTEGKNVLHFTKTHDAAQNRDVWSMTKPDASKAQSAKVESLLYKLWNLKGDSLVKENPAAGELQAYGLAEPSVRFELGDQDGKPLGAILLGREMGEQRFATRDDHAAVLTVSKTALQDISSQAADYKDEPAPAKTN